MVVLPSNGHHSKGDASKMNEEKEEMEEKWRYTSTSTPPLVHQICLVVKPL